MPATSVMPPPKPQTSGVVIPNQAKWHQKLLAFIIYALVRTISLTVRFSLEDRTGIFPGAPKEPVIFAVWHNRLALSAAMYRRYVRPYAPDRRIAGLVSASRDGALLARIFELLRIEPVRGSSSRRGAQAVREMVSKGEAGFDLAITPDGPRGPCYHVQDGVITVAQLTGMPILPVVYHVKWKFRIKSWDRFQVPLPFTRCQIIVGQAIRIPREITDGEHEQYRAGLEKELRALTGED